MTSYRLDLQPIGNPPEGESIRRLRSGLKSLLRGHQLRCVKCVEILEDGAILHGDGWIRPEDFLDDDIASGRLLALKGCTDPGAFELLPASVHVSTEPRHA